jgi:hypothetical protein
MEDGENKIINFEFSDDGYWIFVVMDNLQLILIEDMKEVVFRYPVISPYSNFLDNDKLWTSSLNGLFCYDLTKGGGIHVFHDFTCHISNYLGTLNPNTVQVFPNTLTRIDEWSIIPRRSYLSFCLRENILSSPLMSKLREKSNSLILIPDDSFSLLGMQVCR